MRWITRTVNIYNCVEYYNKHGVLIDHHEIMFLSKIYTKTDFQQEDQPKYCGTVCSFITSCADDVPL